MRLTQEFIDFVTAHLNDEPSSLRLAFYGKDISGVEDIESAVLQVECRRRYRRKLAGTLSRFPDFFFPSKLVAEQSTSDLMARFHTMVAADWLAISHTERARSDSDPSRSSRLVTPGPGPSPRYRLADLTAGLGIDIFHLAALPEVENALAVEIDPAHAEALGFNGAGLGLEGKIDVLCADCHDVVEDKIGGLCADTPDMIPAPALESTAHVWDLVFIDPARRDGNGRKVFMLADCRPDLLAMLPDILRKSRLLFVKLSPMIDITEVTRNLPCRRVIVTGTTTECKEVLALVDPVFAARGLSPRVECVTVFGEKNEGGEKEVFAEGGDAGGKDKGLDFSSLEISGEYPSPGYGMPSSDDYIFEPYPAVMKPGASSAGAVCARLGVSKIAPNTHLYYLKADKEIVPRALDRGLHLFGHMMAVEKILPYSSKEIRNLYKSYPVAEIKARNFRVKGRGEALKASELQRKLKIKDGPTDIRIFAVTDLGSTPWLIVTRYIR